MAIKFEIGLTREQAICMAPSNWWADMAARDITMFQMHESRLCMPFHVFHEAVEQALNRPVYAHEFGLNRDGLLRELLGEQPTPTLDKIIRLIPASKRLVAQHVDAHDAGVAFSRAPAASPDPTCFTCDRALRERGVSCPTCDFEFCVKTCWARHVARCLGEMRALLEHG